MDGEVSGWDSQMDSISGWDDEMKVLNLKECTSYTCKVSYPRVGEVCK